MTDLEIAGNKDAFGALAERSEHTSKTKLRHDTKMKTIRSNDSFVPYYTSTSRPLIARRAGRFSLVVLSCFLSLRTPAAEPSRVTLMRTPDGGIQPQAAMDSQGVVHLIYYKGDAGGGDVFYARQGPGQSAFSKPLQVNSQRGSAIAAGTIRGAQLAVGKNGRVHVAWNGGKGATPITLNGQNVTPMLYTRLNDAGIAFEPERNLNKFWGLDGGGSVAADSKGNVYVVWHAPGPGASNEAGRVVFVARSMDEGKTFQREKEAISQPTGACGCCGLRAFADSAGAVYILYRGASETVNRDEILLVSPQPGAEFQIAYSHPWKIPTCVMSSATLTESKGRVWAAWETTGQVYFTSVNSKTWKVSEPIAPPGSTKRKHPAVAANANGDTLFVWTEGTGWAKGGAVAWQLYDKDGNATSERGRADGVPVWGLATTFAKSDGRFVIVH